MNNYEEHRTKLQKAINKVIAEWIEHLKEENLATDWAIDRQIMIVCDKIKNEIRTRMEGGK